jgi:raffinose/stachyose/melibiose transport system permease protein/N-acetylglucosamine transport system permease protein
MEKINRSKSEKVVLIIFFVVFLLYAISLIFPFAWLLNNSFKLSRDFFTNLWSLPKTFFLGNYSEAFSEKIRGFNIISMFLNSVFITCIGTILSLLCSCLAAYTIAKYKFFGRDIIYMIAISIMLIPTVGAVTATYKLLIDTKLYNSYLGIFLLYSGGFGFSFLLLYGYFKNISWSYAEAAFVDGASDFKVFIKIMLPQAMPAITALAVIQAIGLWNDYFTPYMYLPKYPTLAVGMQELVLKMDSQSNYPRLFAIMIISIIPIIILFICFQKTIMDNTVTGGLKG